MWPIGSNRRKFIISDLDGTLLDQADSLSANYIDDLNRLMDQGLQFTIATGRDLEKARKALPGLKLPYPVVLTNGALLGDLEKMVYLLVTNIPSKIAQIIMKMAAERSIPPMVFAAYDRKHSVMHFIKGKWGKKGIHPLTPDKYEPFRALDIVSIQYHAHKNDLISLKAAIEAQFKDQFNLIYIEDVGYRNETGIKDWYWLEINAKEAGKANGLRNLALQTGVDLADMVVFGDNYNDIEMMKIGGFAVAVENAPEEVKAAAKKICGPNTRGGVIEFLKEHFSEFI